MNSVVICGRRKKGKYKNNFYEEAVLLSAMSYNFSERFQLKNDLFIQQALLLTIGFK